MKWLRRFYWAWYWPWQRIGCKHERRRNIYGDEIIAAGFKRSQCLDCGKMFNRLAPT